LAVGAPDGGALGEDGVGQRRAAGEARQITTAVDPVRLGRGARAAQGVDVVAERAASLGDGVAEHVTNALGERVPLALAEVACLREGVELGEKERFIRVDVAHAGEHGLVEQDGLDGASGATGGTEQVVALDGERVGAEVLPCDGVELLAGGHGAKAAEAARIAEEHGGVAIDGPQRVHMGVEGNGGRIVEEEDLAGHAELDDEATAIMGDDGELLAATFERGDGRVMQQCGSACRDGACEGRADIRAKEPSVGDGASDESGFEGAAEGFDFREFWHDGSDRAWACRRTGGGIVRLSLSHSERWREA
jgi:hypothetical protein